MHYNTLSKRENSMINANGRSIENYNFLDLLSLDKKNTKNEKAVTKNNVYSLYPDFQKYEKYNLDDYKRDIVKHGLRKTWNSISHYLLNHITHNTFLSVGKLAELYEIGLALQDKQAKKNSGQYYTPDDVATVMSKWLYNQKGTNVCDVACGTGKLILTYLDLLGKPKAIDLIRNGRVYLYDLDKVALNICKTIILLKYGKNLEPFIHIVQGDFLANKITLPTDCKVISNPPYASINSIPRQWDKSEVVLSTKELYSIFMEKIIKQSTSSVIITPYSFVGASKYYPLRKFLNDYNGFIVSFDNVPGNIFCGRKHGIFNTNTSNSVRASITVVENKNGYKGFRTTPLIRFKNEERKKLLKTNVLESFVNNEYQIVTKDNPMYYKCAKQLDPIWRAWKSESKKCLGDYVCEHGQNVLSMPKTCRYYTTASSGLMNRNGQIVLNIKNKDVANYIYCMINSSFAYWYWRLFDGGISYPKNLLFSMPVFYDKLSKRDILFLNNMATKMINCSSKYVVSKKNVGIQENIKYPREYRDKLNKRFLSILGLNIDEKIFDLIHSNMALKVSV